MKLLNKILIANRGEIAVRIIRTLSRLGIRSVAVYSRHDRDALHVRLADEAYDLGGNDLKGTYLDIQKIIHIARQSGADGIHPGYGFLSENAVFSKAVSESGINFIGPNAEVIGLMGDKLMARKTMRKMGIPMIEGFEGSCEEILYRTNELTYPILIKAAAGGGGKAIRIVQEANELKESLEISTREAQNYFGNGILLVERYMSESRHIEVQLLADHYGNLLIIGDRECTVQRRFQKVIEESPALSVLQKTRDSIYSTAKKIAETIKYINAGTLEFLVDKAGNHFFLEMNTRIQVEHPVTEMVTGLDLVELQILIAAGNQLHLKQSDIKITGHAIEARLYAENPENNFLPSPGKIELYHQPQLPGLRIDSGVDGPDIMHPEYDPLIAKIIFHGHSRDEAIDGLKLALKDLTLLGLKTNREFLMEILHEPHFLKNNISTTYLDKISSELNDNLRYRKSGILNSRIFAAWLGWKMYWNQEIETDSVWNQIGFWRLSIRKSILFNNQTFDIYVESISGASIRFSIAGEIHEIKLKSKSPERIIFELNGEWSSASVSHTNSCEDIICIEGMEFNIRPLDCLPVQPFLFDHQEKESGKTRIIKSPLHGKISRIITETGGIIKKGDFLFSLDVMKIENKITSPYEGCLREIRVKSGDQVQINQTILIIDECKIKNTK